MLSKELKKSAQQVLELEAKIEKLEDTKMENLAEKKRLALIKIGSDFLAEHPNASLRTLWCLQRASMKLIDVFLL